MPKPLQFDMVFLDHLKPLYTVDLKVMEEEGLIGPVSTNHSSLLYIIKTRPFPCPSRPQTSRFLIVPPPIPPMYPVK